MSVPIKSLFRTPDRFLRSVNLERDFGDAIALQHYLVTPVIEQALTRVSEGLRTGSGQRAWRLTGSFGTGKSSFALMLAHLLSNSVETNLQSLQQIVKMAGGDSAEFIPILVTGDRTSIASSIAKSILRAGQRLPRKRTGKVLKAIFAQATAVSESGNTADMLDLLGQFRAYVGRQHGSGVLLIVDELGKFLEYAALNPETEDVYILQQLAEMAAGSADTPLIVLGILHQGFHAYAERLPDAAREEWQKVAGRYGEIAFDQPLTHVAALAQGALNLDSMRLPDAVRQTAAATYAEIEKTGWFGTVLGASDVARLYPIHPMALPVLVRFFARYGQYERSLFSFLLSSEPFGVQYFSERAATASTWYRLADFYDFVRAVYGHQLSDLRSRSNWMRIVEIIDHATRAESITSRAICLLKSVAILNLLDAEDLVPTEAVLMAVLGSTEDDIKHDAAALKQSGLLYRRGIAGGYSLWAHTSIDLEAAYQAAKRSLGPIGQLAAQLARFLDSRAILARRHYIETGTLRYFERRYVPWTHFRSVAVKPTDADGLILVILCESAQERNDALAMLRENKTAHSQQVLIAIPAPLHDFEVELTDALIWEEVARNTPQLAQDKYASAEVQREVTRSNQQLNTRVTIQLGLNNVHGQIVWWHQGGQVAMSEGVSDFLSTLCGQVYAAAPMIHHELLNRNQLRGAAVRARSKLIERMFDHADKRDLGFDSEKAPPERSMYLSVLHKGQLHREINGMYRLVISAENDPLNLYPAVSQLLNYLEQADNNRVFVPQLYDLLRAAPFGIRDGVATLILAFIVTAYAHQIAVYENGNFSVQFDAPGFLRLVKDPKRFEFQWCRVEGVRADVFIQLARILHVEQAITPEPELLHIVQPLMVFAAKLPKYTLNHTHLPDEATRVRNALLKADDPAKLLFITLPNVLGFPKFTAVEATDGEMAQRFATKLAETLDVLRWAYDQLLVRIRDQIMIGLLDSAVPDRATIARRANRLLVSVREPRLAAFARALADMRLDDEAWAVRVGSFVISKTPSVWSVTDEYRALGEIDDLIGRFRRVEATAFTKEGGTPNPTSMRVVLTQADGTEAAHVVNIRREDEERLNTLVEQVEASFLGGDDLKLAVLVRMLQTYNFTGNRT